MSTALPIVYLARHGDTAWTLSGQHTGLTDLPLTPNGERKARRLGVRLKGQQFAKVFTSPLQRAARTCELAGFGDVAETDPTLVEWNYGQYEGLRSADILAKRPEWDLFPGRLPWGRVAGPDRRKGGSRRLAPARCERECSPLFERTLSPRTRCPLARPCAGVRRQVFRVEHRKPERFGLRTQTVGTGDPLME